MLSNLLDAYSHYLTTDTWHTVRLVKRTNDEITIETRSHTFVIKREVNPILELLHLAKHEHNKVHYVFESDYARYIWEKINGRVHDTE